MRNPHLSDFIEDHPDLLELVTEQLSKVDIVTFDSGVAFLEVVTTFYYGTTPASILTNFLKHMGSELPKFMFDTDV